MTIFDRDLDLRGRTVLLRGGDDGPELYDITGDHIRFVRSGYVVYEDSRGAQSYQNIKECGSTTSDIIAVVADEAAGASKPKTDDDEGMLARIEKLERAIFGREE